MLFGVATLLRKYRFLSSNMKLSIAVATALAGLVTASVMGGRDYIKQCKPLDATCKTAKECCKGLDCVTSFPMHPQPPNTCLPEGTIVRLYSREKSVHY